jgi:cytidine deaminase
MAELSRERVPQLPSDLTELVQKAQAARATAYAPYSQFLVGAAVRTSDGRVFAGANVENASYGLSVCAERSAVLAAVLAGSREVVAVAVCTELSPPAAPCGMCRQTLAEFATDCPVVLCGPHGLDGQVLVTRLRELLPHAFVPATLHAFTEALGSQSDTQPVPKTDAHDVRGSR